MSAPPLGPTAPHGPPEPQAPPGSQRPRGLPREVILASAGSGKTFRISSRIIGLLAAGEPPTGIFASTFTRKAAGEILDRVLVRLARAALDADEARELAAHAALDDAAPPPADPTFWLDLLQRTVRQLHRIDIGTLDAFFVRTVGLFGHDLGLPPRWGIADDPAAERIRADALQDVLAMVDDGVRVELVRGLAAGAARRAVLDALVREVDDIAAVHHALDPDAPGWSALRAAAPERPADFDARRQRLADHLRAADVPTKANGEPDGRWIKALGQVADGVENGDWESFLGATIFCRAIDGGDEEFYGKRIPDGIVALMLDALELARMALAPRLAARADAMARLGALYADAFQRRLLDGGALRFDDVTHLLGGTAGGPAAVTGRPELAYRMDGRTRHLLLDEFQDTSLVQWAALEPMADLLLARADGCAAVVVADPKQSIYGWRGAAPVVVDHLSDRYQLADQVLARSWRSSQVVLDALNTIFTGIEDRDAFADDPVDREIARDWARAFTPHLAAKSLPGHVRLQVGPRDGGSGSQKPRLCRCAADLIRELHEAAPGRSIGVLTRTNATVARLMFELRELGVPASEEGGAALTDSGAVASVLALLRLADHPGDTLAAYHVARTPVGAAVGLDHAAEPRAVSRAAHDLRARLIERGYGRTLARIAERVRHAASLRDRARLAQLVELGFRYDERATLRIDDFVRVATAERVEVPARSDVRVMTVHQAKGLEFDIVVLPELEASLTRGGGGAHPLAFRSTAVGPVTHAFPPMSAGLRRVFDHIPELAGAYQQARAAEVRDALSALYVATSRARYALHMLIAADGEKGPGTPRTYGRLIREALVGPPVREEPAVEGALLLETGDPDWHRIVPGTEPAAAPHPSFAGQASANIPLRPTERRTRMLGRRKPSDLEAGADLRRVLGLDPTGAAAAIQRADAARARGTLAHAWLERVAWIDDGLPDRTELRVIARRAAPWMDPDEVERRAEWLEARLRVPAIHDALARGRYPAGAIVENEIPFLRRDRDSLLEGVIDRLVLQRDGGRVVAAEVLDFKTDAIEARDAAAVDDAAARHTPQVHAYRAAVADMYGLELDVVKGTLVFLTPGVIRQVG